MSNYANCFISLKHKPPRPTMAGHVTGLGRHRQTVLAAQNRADFVALELELSQPKFKGKDGGPSRRKIEPWCFPVSIIAFLVLLLICIPMFGNEKASDEINKSSSGEPCNDTCRLSIHQGASQQWISLNDTKHLQRWSDLMAQARSSIDILTVYSTHGNRLFQFLEQLSVPSNSMARIRIVLLIQNTDTIFDAASWLNLMSELDNQVEVRTLAFDMGRFHVRSLPHMLLIDKCYFSMSSTIFTTQKPYSENALTLEAENCSCSSGSSLTTDLQKVFQTYWAQGRNPVDGSESAGQNIPSREKNAVPDLNSSKPDPFDSAFLVSMTVPLVASSSINVSTGFLNMDRRMSSGLLTAFPAELLTSVEAICAVLQASRDFLYISIANYRPELSLDALHLNSTDTDKRALYWPALDSALRAAFVSRKLDIRLIVQIENVDYQYLRSLEALDGFNGNSFQIKTITSKSSGTVNRTQVPFVAGNIVVSTNAAHFGSSGWDGDSLTMLPGFGLTILPPYFCQKNNHFCSAIRAQREALSGGTSDKPAIGSRSSGSARSTAPPSYRNAVSRTPKDQQRLYPPPRLSSSQIELQASLIEELKTLFELQWDHPDANEL